MGQVVDLLPYLAAKDAEPATHVMPKECPVCGHNELRVRSNDRGTSFRCLKCNALVKALVRESPVSRLLRRIGAQHQLPNGEPDVVGWAYAKHEVVLELSDDRTHLWWDGPDGISSEDLREIELVSPIAYAQLMRQETSG